MPVEYRLSAMNFDFSDDQRVLRDQARKFLSQESTPARVRRVLETDDAYDEKLWRGMGVPKGLPAKK